jgi:uncharacterized coiled-coil protein SlyX
VAEDDLEVRITRVETRQEAQQRIIEMLESDLQETRNLIHHLDERIDNKFAALGQRFDQLHISVQDALKAAAENVPTRLLYGVSAVIGVASLIVGALGGRLIH